MTKKKMKFYFTFGSDEKYPYQNGWVTVIATDLQMAIGFYKARFNDDNPGTVNCADFYTQQEFRKTDMYLNGNRGAYCHEVFGLIK